MRKFNIEDIPSSLIHQQVKRKALIKVGDCQSNLQTVNKAWLEPGKGFRSHRHPDCEEFFYFLKGKGKMTVDKNDFSVKAGDCFLIERNEAHSLTNNSSSKLCFITIRILV